MVLPPQRGQRARGRRAQDGASLTAGPGSPPGTLPVTPRAVIRPRPWGRFFGCCGGALLALPTLSPPNPFCRVYGTAVPVCPRTACDGSGSPRPLAPSPLVGALTGCSPPLLPQCAVQVKLELGHRAQVRKKPTVEGFTHDWMVFVRGPEHSNIQHFVEKVIFHLHESFPRPKRGSGVSWDALSEAAWSGRRRWVCPRLGGEQKRLAEQRWLPGLSRSESCPGSGGAPLRPLLPLGCPFAGSGPGAGSVILRWWVARS